MVTRRILNIITWIGNSNQNQNEKYCNIVAPSTGTLRAPRGMRPPGVCPPPPPGAPPPPPGAPPPPPGAPPPPPPARHAQPPPPPPPHHRHPVSLVLLLLY